MVNLRVRLGSLHGQSTTKDTTTRKVVRDSDGIVSIHVSQLGLKNPFVIFVVRKALNEALAPWGNGRASQRADSRTASWAGDRIFKKGYQNMKDQSMADTTAKGSSKWQQVGLEYAKAILLALMLAFVIRLFIVQPFLIPSGSMENTLDVGDRILVNKFIYGTEIPFTHDRILEIRAPRRGDVIVFAYPKDPSEDFIKRIVGLPGDRIRIVDKKVYVNGKLFKNPHEIHRSPYVMPAFMGPRDNMAPITVPAHCYFVMGDNLDNSYDSRFWGCVPRQNIKGLAFIKYWSWDQKHWRVRWGRIGQPID